ncbi:MAG: pantoate--beta-alanine ligase [Candidatus Cloacimonas sp. 4484_209]|nr:MAG: pantoate--beta-alanine ligase [Candidatus Cloacimonas sp. 4484_209]
MKTIKKIKRMQEISDGLRRNKKTIGFVPTMGFLHKGHLSLIDIANKMSDVTVVSIFVNPTQFGPNEDFGNYPRDLERDKKLLREKGCSILFYPDAKKMYNEGFRTEVYVKGLSKVLCGATRKTHFKGVTTVVAKLFNIVKPDIAVFGQKDAQQAIIIKRMVKDLNYNIKIITGPIIREDDGLAMSSRNIYLTKQQRKDATILYESLKEAKRMISNGEAKASRVIKQMKKMISSKKTARIDYIKAVDTKELKTVKYIKGEVLIAVACYFGRARLIDNIIVNV